MDTSIAFHGISFPSGAAALRYLRALVDTLERDTWFVPGDNDFERLLDALAYHPSWGTRLGSITRLRIERERGAGLACVVVLRDGTRDKVGWTKTFSQPVTARARVVAALRAEVIDQVRAFRALVEDGTIPAVSTISGTRLIMRGARRFHVDHAPAFADTAEAWIADQGGIARIPVVRALGGGWMLDDDAQADNWWDFHAERHNAERGFRAITAEENLGLLHV